MMKTSNTLKNISRLAGMLAITLTAVSCGSYQGSSYYDNDGIYGRNVAYSNERPVKQQPAQANSGGTDYQQRFANMEQQLEFMQEQMYENEIFTDIDSYYSGNGDIDSTQIAENLNYNYMQGYGPWGDNAETTVVRVHVFNNFGWGWGGWYGPYWGWPYNYGWGWGGWYDPFWGPYYGYGWAGWYGAGYWNPYYGYGWGGWYGNNYYHNRPYYYSGGRYAYSPARRGYSNQMAGSPTSRDGYYNRRGASSRDYNGITSRRGTSGTSSDLSNRRGYSNRSNIGVDRYARGNNSGYIPSNRAQSYRNDNYSSSSRRTSNAGNQSYSNNRSSNYSSRSSSSSSGYSRSSSSGSSSRGSSSSSGGGGRRGNN